MRNDGEGGRESERGRKEASNVGWRGGRVMGDMGRRRGKGKGGGSSTVGALTSC